LSSPHAGPGVPIVRPGYIDADSIDIDTCCAIDRLLEKGLASRVESRDDRRVRIVALTKNGKDVIVPMIF